MAINQKRLGAILQYCQIFINIIIGLIYSPIMLRILGQNEYGIYSVAYSTISMLSLLSLGLGGSYLRYYSIFKVKNDEKGISNLNGLYLLVFSIIGIITLTIGLFLSTNVGMFFNDSYSSYEQSVAKILIIILSINMALSFPLSIFNSFITSQEKYVFQKIVGMLTTIVGPCLNIVLLFFGYGSIGMVSCALFITIAGGLINIFFCLGKLKMRISFTDMKIKLLKDVFVFSIFIAMNQIIEQINWQTDKIILGKMVSGSAVAIYSVGSHINSLFVQFSTSISSVFAPKVNLLVQKNPQNLNQLLTDLFITVGRIQWFILFLIFSGFIFFGQYFMYLWVGDGYQNSYYIALILMAPEIVPLIQNVGIEIQRAKNKHQIRSIVYFIVAILNVLISIFLAYFYGEVGCAIGTAISLILGPIIFMNIYYHNKLKINMKQFWISILKTLPGILLPVLYGVFILLFHKFVSIADFLIMIIVYSCIYIISIYKLSLNKSEKEYFSYLFSFLRKRRKSNDDKKNIENF